jgi:uncharacterized protein (DUF302 family)
VLCVPQPHLAPDAAVRSPEGRDELRANVSGGLDPVKKRLLAALATEGFGVLTAIDVQRTLREKLGVTMERYEILGVCNPTLAHQALEVDRGLGLFLPCNIVLREVGPDTEIRIQDPVATFETADLEGPVEIADLSGEARRRLAAALRRVLEKP